jgi:hypothetical protein
MKSFSKTTSSAVSWLAVAVPNVLETLTAPFGMGLFFIIILQHLGFPST